MPKPEQQHNSFEQAFKKRGAKIFENIAPHNPERSSSNTASKPDIKNPNSFYDRLDTSRAIHLISRFKLEATEKTPTARRQDEIYDSLGLEYIDPPHPDTSLSAPTEFSRETMKAFLFTNENLADFMEEHLNLEGKKVATIGGSADFIINAFMYGAKSVRPFDIALLACFLGEVKMAAHSKLSYKEFLNFFNPFKKNQFFSHNQYDKLKPNISNHAQHYLDQLIHPDGNSNFLSPDGMLAIPLVDNTKVNPYLQSEENYEKAKKNSEPVIFYPQEMTEFLKQTKENYDHIHTTNMFSYPPYAYHPESSNIDYSKVIQNKNNIIKAIQTAHDRLTPEGTISTYIFGPNPKARNILITNLFNKENNNKITMKGTTITGEHSNPEKKYSVLLLKKSAGN
jgi:hypothetical protein